MKLNLNVEQRQVLTPKMEQSLKILQMDNLELEEYVQRVSEENPVVDFAQDQETEQRKELLRRKLDLITNEDNRSVVGYDSYYTEEDETDPMERLRTPELSMHEELTEQLGVLRISKCEYQTALYVVDCLDDNGYLTVSVEEMAAHTGWSEDRLFMGLEIVKTLEPAGVGASSLSECLILQLERKGLLTQQMRSIIEEYLPQLGQGHFNQIAAALGQTPDFVKGCYRLIRELNPKPCASLGGTRNVRYIIPDIAVVKFKDHFDVVLNDLVSPRIIVRRDYLSLLGKGADNEATKYVEKKLSQADWVVSTIERRNKTLISVGRAIVDRQVGFFQSGPKHLKPMTLADVATAVELHPSTISRVANSKYLQCSYGVFPLRAFFTQGIESTAGDDNRSSTSVKEIIAEMIAGENPDKPLSDQAIADKLQKDGADISRRTVAKYREQLGIGSSSVRKAQR
ncbi:MAG: RNA polymerase factor sigma-54 [Angelakisella sp.]|nr:RNA polymerase factor sigma-54 [Angelakisella sp.]